MAKGFKNKGLLLGMVLCCGALLLTGCGSSGETNKEKGSKKSGTAAVMLASEYRDEEECPVGVYNRDEYGLCTVEKKVTEEGFKLEIGDEHGTYYYLTFYLDQGKMEKIDRTNGESWGYSDLEEYKYVHRLSDGSVRYYNEDYQLMYEEDAENTPGIYYYTYDDAGRLLKKEGTRDNQNYLLENTYSENGNLILYVLTIGDSIISREEYTDDEYDEMGNCRYMYDRNHQKMERYAMDRYEYEFAEDGTLLKKISEDGNYWEEYDANGNMILEGDFRGSYTKYQEYQVVNDDLLLFLLNVSQNSDMVNP